MVDEKAVRTELLAAIRDFPDFPTPGILFKDIMPLFYDPKLLKDVTDLLASKISALKLKSPVLAGLEARGFLLGPLIAVKLGLKFVPIRKRGKLPGPTIKASYQKEYGPDTMEIQADAIQPGDDVVLIDDLIATGGSLIAACQLVRDAKASVKGIFCLIELTKLSARSLPAFNSIHLWSLIQYDD